MEITEAKRERDRFYYELHADTIFERHRRWYRANRERALKRAKAYRLAHPVDYTTEAYREAERERWHSRMKDPAFRKWNRDRTRQWRERRQFARELGLD